MMSNCWERLKERQLTPSKDSKIVRDSLVHSIMCGVHNRSLVKYFGNFHNCRHRTWGGYLHVSDVQEFIPSFVLAVERGGSIVNKPFGISEKKTVVLKLLKEYLEKVISSQILKES